VVTLSCELPERLAISADTSGMLAIVAVIVFAVH
jgi:hypothetical protein